MARILATSLIALLLVAGGFWLAARSPAAAQASAQDKAGNGAATGGAQQLPDDLTLPDGFTMTPFVSEEQQQSFQAPEQVLAPNTDYGAVIVTNKGAMTVDLLEAKTPETVNSFVFLALHHYFDGVVFHRVLEDFMAQTGDPTGTGRGGPGYEF
ncbi:MAG TPA: peptidylprolyl isomerase, partial [Trueperaceae bacterium]